MRIKLESTFGERNYKGTNERGQSVQFSGNKESVSPMETVLMAAAACSSIDVDLILKKMRQDFVSLEVDAQADRADDEVPAVFKKINLHYIIKGNNLKEEKVRQAVQMSLETYCSVSKMLEKTALITHTVEVVDLQKNA
ncbi:MAG: OsmC family protein [Saprospiraceae bacterium]|nr:OsmC family protein [Saprospiraceae bacterium]HMS69977.1 OsmC family protein [Saprospiraceae bacterium]